MVAEVLRSGAFSDESVMNFVNRRFVSFFYDVAPPGKNAGDAWAYDAEAVKAFGQLDRRASGARPSGGSQGAGGRVVANSYPAALLYDTRAGELVGKGAWGIVPPERMLAFLRELVAQHPALFTTPPEELAIAERAEKAPQDAGAQLADARLAWELAEWDRCLRRVEAGASSEGCEPATKSELLYLRGRVQLCQHRPKDARASLEEALDLARNAAPALIDDILCALGHAHAQEQDDRAALALFERVLREHASSDRVGEALYYAGLCHHRLGDARAAKALWRHHRKSLPFDRLARRSAASLGLPEAQAFLNQELLEREGWW